jgi:hypothetical protein
VLDKRNYLQPPSRLHITGAVSTGGTGALWTANTFCFAEYDGKSGYVRCDDASAMKTLPLGAATAPSGMLHGDIISVDISNGRAVVMFDVGPTDGVMPGSKGYFVAGGKKIANAADFEVYKVSKGSAFAVTGFGTSDAPQKAAPGGAYIEGGHTCKLAGTKPDMSPREVALGTKPPAGFVFATATSTTEWGDTHVAFMLDKGTDDGVTPTSQAYVLVPGMGTAMPYAVEITWATKNTSGGKARVIKPATDKDLIRKVGVEIATCKK